MYECHLLSLNMPIHKVPVKDPMQSSSSSKHPPRFDATDADVTLHTSDGISFKVHSRILIEASSFFRDLFTLPQPASDQSTLPRVDFPERGEVMHVLLAFAYPFEDPSIDSLSLLSDVLGAALKYDMARAIQTLQRLLVSPHFMQKEPLKVYAIACRHNLEAEMKLASTQTLAINVIDTPLTEELKHITAYDFHRLLILHRTRGIKAEQLIVHNNNAAACSSCSNDYTLVPPRWWNNFATRAKAEVQRAPTTDVIFSMPFLAEAAAAGCQSCGTSIFKSHKLLEELKKSLDALPATI